MGSKLLKVRLPLLLELVALRYDRIDCRLHFLTLRRLIGDALVFFETHSRCVNLRRGQLLLQCGVQRLDVVQLLLQLLAAGFRVLWRMNDAFERTYSLGPYRS